MSKPETSTRVLAAVVVPPHLSVSGGARAAEQLSEALASSCDITVASMMNGAGAAVATGQQRTPVRSWLPPLLPWSRLPDRYATLFYRSDLPRMVARGNWDLVHLHNPMPALELRRVARACRRRGIPYVVSTHGFNEVANGATVYRFDALRRAIWQRCALAPLGEVVRHAAAIFALSPADVTIVRTMGFLGTTVLVPNGVPLPSPGAAADDASLLAELGIPTARQPGQLTCLFLANHTPNKGLPQLFEAFARLSLPYLLIVAGEQRRGIDYAAAQAACRPGQQVVMTGRVSDAAIGALYRRSDIFVFPTLADTFPLVVLEAMAHGLPVVATRVGGIPHQIDSSCGALIPPGDVGELVSTIERLAGDPSSLLALGSNCRARVDAEFTWPRAAAAAAAGYATVLREAIRPTQAGASLVEAKLHVE